jgi:hypothetical protein
LENLIYASNEIIREKNLHLRTLGRKLKLLEIMLQNANNDINYDKLKEIVDQRLNDKRSLLVVALIAVLQTLKANPYGLKLLNFSSLDIEEYANSGVDGKNLLQFAEYDNLLKHTGHYIMTAKAS